MIIPQFGPEHGTWFVDFTDAFEKEAETLLGSYARAAEALEGLFWVLGHGPDTYGTPVPESSIRVAFLDFEGDQFSVFYRNDEDTVTLLSILPVEAEDLG